MSRTLPVEMARQIADAVLDGDGLFDRIEAGLSHAASCAYLMRIAAENAQLCGFDIHHDALAGTLALLHSELRLIETLSQCVRTSNVQQG